MVNDNSNKLKLNVLYQKLKSYKSCIIPCIYASNYDDDYREGSTTIDVERSHLATAESANVSEDYAKPLNIFIPRYKYDDPEALKRTMAVVTTESGRDRLKKLFIACPGETFSPAQNVTLVSIVGSFLTMIIFYKKAIEDVRESFLRENSVTKFETRYQAFRLMNDQIIIRSTVKTLGFAWRSFIFGLTFLGISLAISSYRNKSSPLDFVAAAAASGALIRFHGGPLASFGAGVLGGSLGLLGGVPVYGLMKIFDETQDQINFRRTYETQLEILRDERILGITQEGDED